MPNYAQNRNRTKAAPYSSDVDCALTQMRSQIELSDADYKVASHYQKIVRQRLEQTLGGFDGSLLIGSYKRHTSIAPLKDVDIAVLINADKRSKLISQGPHACLNAVRASLDEAFEKIHKAPMMQRRSVGVEFRRGDLKFDVVPALSTDRAGVLLIADRDADRWLLTAPEMHAVISTEMNRRSGGFLKPIIKMVKAWKLDRRVPLKSFHLEVMCYKALSAQPPSMAHGLYLTFVHLARAISQKCPDPTKIGYDIDDDLSPEKRQVASSALHAASCLAMDAVHYEYEFDQTAEAHNCWKGIFGDLYPRDYWR